LSFVSLTFLVFFLVFLIGYFLFLKKIQWILLLIGSYVLFYSWASPKMLLFLLFSTTITWLFPLLIGKEYHRRDLYSSQHSELTKDEKENCSEISPSSCKTIYRTYYSM
jgi:alginate O-acetyltransferase complex protein AlgI